MLDFVDFVERMDRCWMEHRFYDLGAFIADDVVMVAPGGRHRIEGLSAAVDSYRDFMGRSRVHRFDTSGHVVTERGDAVVVEYDWEMGWDSEGSTHEATGREILVLARRDDEWRVVWRMQLPG